ncbi:MAG: hypothetical protein H5T69_03560 [Chloroflexi bacterium]|nr:hypothetical protein [Chloroflexota bacterium]
MFIKEAMEVFWQTLKDTWEELYSLAIVNLVWLFAWALPLGLASASGLPAVFFPVLILSLGLFAVGTSGVYYVANRVAHAKTFHFYDFVEGIKIYWWRALLWLLINVAAIYLIILNLQFYPSVFQGSWVIFISGFWLAILAFWLAMQVYYWPLVIQQEKPKLLLGWRNAAYLLLANPFYAFFVISFAIVLLVISAALTLPFVFVGMAMQAVLGSNAVLTLLYKFGIIENPRPPLRS